MNKILRFGLDRDFTDKQGDPSESTVEEVNELAAKHINVDNMAIVVVGDKETIYDGLSKLPYEIEVVNLSVDVAND